MLASVAMRLRRPTASEAVLGLLCVMYLITYVDRVNIATAATEIKRELALSNTQLAFILSAFGYPYIVFQIFGGWIGDRVGPRRTLFLCGLIWAAATILTGFAGSLTTLFLVRLLLGVGEGATFPVATRAMQAWTSPGRRGFAQGITHAFARLGNAMTPPIVAWLIGRRHLARLVRRARLSEPAVGRGVGLVFPRCPVGASARSPLPNSRSCRIVAARQALPDVRRTASRSVATARRADVAGCTSSTSATGGRCGCT